MFSVSISIPRELFETRSIWIPEYVAEHTPLFEASMLELVSSAPNGNCRSDEPKYCKVFDGVGRRLKSMASVDDGEVLYVVPQHRTFVWPTIKIGRQVKVPHVKTPLGELLHKKQLGAMLLPCPI